MPVTTPVHYGFKDAYGEISASTAVAFTGSAEVTQMLGAACRNRTDDLFITSESLYRLS